MCKLGAAIGSLAFLVIAPGVVAGYLPWLLTRWESRSVPEPWSWAVLPLRALGGVLVLAGAGVVIAAFVRFVTEGLGTPAPVAPPQRLVIGGLYRYVRNPMYVAVLACVVGQALLLLAPVLLLYAVICAVVMVSFVRFYEEPALARRFGADYDAYRRGVPGWWPRLRAWQPPHDAAT